MNSYEQVTPAVELQVRIARFQESLRQDGVDGALIVQKTDLFYSRDRQQDAVCPAAGFRF